jgi:hypothetical protein
VTKRYLASKKTNEAIKTNLQELKINVRQNSEEADLLSIEAVSLENTSRLAGEF